VKVLRAGLAALEDTTDGDMDKPMRMTKPVIRLAFLSRSRRPRAVSCEAESIRLEPITSERNSSVVSANDCARPTNGPVRASYGLAK
jgi:hypothetical protein